MSGAIRECRQVLFVDDDRDVREAIGQSLTLAGFRVIAARAFIEAKDHVFRGFPGVVLTDVRMPGKDGMHLLELCRQVDPELPVVLLTGEGDIPMAVRAMAEGAFDFLEKPCPAADLAAVMDRAAAARASCLAGRARGAAAHVGRLDAAPSLTAAMDEVERYLIEEALRQQKGRVTATADALGLPRKTLYDKMARHRIEPGVFRET